MRRFHAALLGLISVGLVAGCSAMPNGGSSSKSTRVVVVTSTADAPEAADAGTNEQVAAYAENNNQSLTELAEAFAKALDNPSAVSMNKTDPFNPKGTFSYAIAEMTGDNSPEMLFRADVSEQFAPVSVFTRGADGQVFNTQDVLVTGASSAGGSRADIMTSASGSGLYENSWQSIGSTVSVQKYVLSGKNLVKSGGKSDIPSRSLPDAEHQKINWLPSADRSGIEALKAGIHPVPQTVAQQGQSQQQAAPSSQQYKYVFEGTIVELTTEEALNGNRNPNGASPDNRYIVFKFDEKQQITALKANDPNYTGTARWIALGQKELGRYSSPDSRGPFQPYVGQRVQLSLDSNSLAFSSGTDLPFGGPRLRSDAKYEIKPL